jgi:hypothetical protein
MEKITMGAFVLVIGLGASLLLFAGRADAQWQYKDDKGVTKVTQYKLDIPGRYRDAAVWTGPTGVGKPALSEEQRQTKQREEEYHRIGEAEAKLMKNCPMCGQAPGAAGPYRGVAPANDTPMAEMCIAGEQKVMTSPGHWKIVGRCYSGPTPLHPEPFTHW